MVVPAVWSGVGVVLRGEEDLGVMRKRGAESEGGGDGGSWRMRDGESCGWV